MTNTLDDPIRHALDDLGLAPDNEHSIPGRATIEHIVRRLAQEAYEAGRHDALTGIVTLRQAADELGIDPTHLSRRANALGLGWKTGTVRLFTREDMARLHR